MGELRSLGQLIADITECDPDSTVYAEKPWSANSRAVCAYEGDDADLPDASGLTYLLEVDLIHDVEEVWSDWRGGSLPTATELTAAVIYYAQFDAFIPVEPT